MIQPQYKVLIFDGKRYMRIFERFTTRDNMQYCFIGYWKKTLFKETIADPNKIIDHTNAATQTNFYMKKQEVKILEQTRETFINFISRLSIAFENLENILQPVFDSLSQENAISQQECDTIKQLRKITPRLRRRKIPWED